MLRIAYIPGVLILCAALYGCAKILNGSTQEVQVNVPSGTAIWDVDSSANLPVNLRDSFSYINLKRNRNYQLRFTYNGDQVQALIPRSFEWQWLVPDYLCLIVPIFVDLATSDWHSFDGLKVHFSGDTLYHEKIENPYCEIIDANIFKKRVGIELLLNAGAVLPTDVFNFFMNEFTIGAGYEITPKFSTFLVLNEIGASIILPHSTAYIDLLNNFNSYQLETRYTVRENIYLSAGGGLLRYSVDSLHYYDSNHASHSSPGFSQYIGSVYAGIGYASTMWFVELRQSFGLSEIKFPNGERGRFQTTSLNYGLNLHF